MGQQETSNNAEGQSVMKQNENEITSLKSKIYELEKEAENIQMRRIASDDSISCLLEEKQKLECDLRSHVRRNESLAEQLKREKEYYRKEKKQFHKEMFMANERRKQGSQKGTRLKRSYAFSKLDCTEANTLSKLRQENSKLKELLSTESKVTFSICIKFQRIKKHKDFIKNRLLGFQEDLHNMVAYLNNLLKDNKQEFDSVSAHCFSGRIHRKDALFLETIQRNHLLVRENLALKSECQELENSLHEKGSRKKTKTSQSESWLTKNSESSISSSQVPEAVREDNMPSTDSCCDAAILDVATAYVTRLTPSMLDKKQGKARRKHRHNDHIVRTRSSPALSDAPPTKPRSAK